MRASKALDDCRASGDGNAASDVGSTPSGFDASSKDCIAQFSTEVVAEERTCSSGQATSSSAASVGGRKEASTSSKDGIDGNDGCDMGTNISTDGDTEIG